MKIWLRPHAGQHINDAAKEALAMGCTHIMHNDRIYLVALRVEEVTGALPSLDAYFQNAPYGVKTVEYSV